MMYVIKLKPEDNRTLTTIQSPADARRSVADAQLDEIKEELAKSSVETDRFLRLFEGLHDGNARKLTVEETEWVVQFCQAALDEINTVEGEADELTPEEKRDRRIRRTLEAVQFIAGASLDNDMTPTIYKA